MVGDFEELSAVLDCDVAPLGKKLAIEVLTGEEPLGKIGASGSVGSGESDRVMVTGVVCVPLVGGLAVVDGYDGSLDGGVVVVEEVHDAVSGPDGVGAHSLSLFLKTTLPCWVAEVKAFHQALVKRLAHSSQRIVPLQKTRPVKRVPEIPLTLKMIGKPELLQQRHMVSFSHFLDLDYQIGLEK